MPTFNINDSGVTVTDDRGDTMTVESNSENYNEACNAAMSADWYGYREIALRPEPTPERDFGVPVETMMSVDSAVDVINGMLSDGLVDPEDLDIDLDDEINSMSELEQLDENDLDNWDGSPIYYPTREMAESQVNNSYGFWSYHDFGPTAPNGYRHATVPNGVGPTAPDGYSWMCLPNTDTGL